MPRSGWEAKRAGNTYAGYRMLVAQDHAQEAIVNRQRALARVIDKSQCAELVHEMADPRPGGADHLRQVFLIDSGMDGSAFLLQLFEALPNYQSHIPRES